MVTSSADLTQYHLRAEFYSQVFTDATQATLTIQPVPLRYPVGVVVVDSELAGQERIVAVAWDLSSDQVRVTITFSTGGIARMCQLAILYPL